MSKGARKGKTDTDVSMAYPNQRSIGAASSYFWGEAHTHTCTETSQSRKALRRRVFRSSLTHHNVVSVLSVLIDLTKGSEFFLFFGVEYFRDFQFRYGKIFMGCVGFYLSGKM